MKSFIILLILIVTYLTIAWATPSRESGATDATPIVAYGKDSSGVLRAILTDSSGVVQTS